MGRKGTWKSVDPAEWTGRRRNGQDYLQAARDLLGLSAEDDNGNPVMSNAVLAAIAYADALTIKVAGIQNTRDHRGAVATLRHALGERADPAQVTRLQRMLARKDDIQYDHRTATIEEARDFLQQAERFTHWAEVELGRP